MSSKSYFKWDKELSTGIEEVDSEHQTLIFIINEVLQLCFSRVRIDKATLEAIHSKLSAYVIQHFNTEEQLMGFYRVDERHFDAHYLAHSEFKLTITRYFSDLSAFETTDKLGEITEFLIRWLAYHILYMDKSMARQIEDIRTSKVTAVEAYEKESHDIESTTEPLLKALRSLFYLVSEKNKELEQMNHVLEEKIHLRTLELEAINKRLEEISLIDELTGLYNRRFAICEIEKLIGYWKRHGTPFAVLFIDLDKFKLVNDTHGHKNGDKVIKWISNYLTSHVRKTDTVSRFGGDEFVIICDRCNDSEALKLAEKLNAQLTSYLLEEIIDMWRPSISIGVAVISEDCETPECLLNKADGVMYEAKRNGDNNSVLAN